MKHIADIVTAVRIAAAIAMLFTLPLSVPFFVIYSVGGVSDMLDGTLARKLGSSGVFGARLDSVADFLFFLSASIKLLPTLLHIIPDFCLWAIGIIVICKLSAAIIGIVKFRKLCFLHTYLNKATGVAVFLLPFFFNINRFDILIYIAVGIAFLAAAEKCICAVRMKEYLADVKGLFVCLPECIRTIQPKNRIIPK